MSPRVAALYRHPVKGFTPEPLAAARLEAGAGFPCDRLYAVEDGPSGFDPAAPAFVAKTRFTVLARLAELARIRTAYDEATTGWRAEAPGAPPFAGRLDDAGDRAAFALWLAAVLGDAVAGPLKVLEGPGAHRFTDHPQGHVSVLNLASVRDLAARIGRPVDPLRFRANVWVEGWEPWEELGWTGRTLDLGGATTRVFKSIVRCAATEVDPQTGERDLDTVKALFDHYGHTLCGLYLNVEAAGDVSVGDAVEISA